MVSLGTSAQVDYIIDSLLAPNKKVKENYHTLVVLTDEGKTIAGIKVRQSESELILRDADDREIAIPLDTIEEQTPGISMMPAGLTEKLTRNELVDLVRFLSSLGKPGPYAVGKSRVVRRWRALSPTKDAMRRLQRTRYSSVTDPADDTFRWDPIYSHVDGALPVGELPEFRVRFRVRPDERGVAFVRAELNVTTGGRCRLLLGSVDGLTLWVDQNPIDVKSTTDLNLTSGRHLITFAIDLGRRAEDRRVELIDLEGSPARAQIVGGK